MSDQKSNTLQWIIIVLISAEIVVCTMELCEVKPQAVVDYFCAIVP